MIRKLTENEEFDFILISVASGKLKDAMATILERNLKGTVILFCNFWNERTDVEQIVGDYEYITAFPTADKIRSYGRRTIYYGHGKPTDKF